MSSIHDNHLVGYSVDGDARRIVLRTERREPDETRERTDVVFDGVEAYAFKYDCLENIVFDICEQPVDVALQAHWAELVAGHRQSGWPRFWQGDDAKTRERVATLVRDGAKWFELTSSYGMEGWVFCRSMRLALGGASPREGAGSS